MTNYKKMTVAQLRQEFETRGDEAKKQLDGYVSKSTKAELIAGLQAHDAVRPPQEEKKRQPRYDEDTLARAVALRDEEQLSWAKIAKALDLGSPGTARRCYRTAKDLDAATPLPRLPGKGGRLPGGHVETVFDENCGGCANGEPCGANGDELCTAQVVVDEEQATA